MLEYEYHRDLFDFLNFEENIECQAMVQHTHGIVLEVEKNIVGTTNYLSLTSDEVSALTTRVGCQFMHMWFKIR